MRAPKRRRSLVRTISGPPSGTDLQGLAARATYVGSPEHKDTPSYVGQIRPRADASLCPRRLARDLPLANKWLREAISRGVTGYPWEGEFPRYVWYKDASTVYEGRLVNRTL